jgi:hypothetical protein
MKHHGPRTSIDEGTENEVMELSTENEVMELSTSTVWRMSEVAVLSGPEDADFDI